MTQPAAQIVPFPFQTQEPGKPLSGLTDAQLIWEWKMQATSYMNEITVRGLALSEQDKTEIRTINALCHRLGYAPIDVDF